MQDHLSQISLHGKHFLVFWVPLGVSIMTLLPVLLTTWDYIGLNGVENLSFCLSLALDRQLEYQIVVCN